MRDWLLQLLIELYSYRRSHPGVLPRWSVTVDILILSMIPTILMYAIANMWLPRHVRLLRFITLAGRYLSVRSKRPGVWYHGLRKLGKHQGVQILRWGVLLGLYVAVPAIWFACLLRFIGTRFGRRLIKGAPDLLSAQNYLGWIAITLAFFCLLMLGARGAVPRLGGPFGRLPIWLARWQLCLLACSLHSARWVMTDGLVRLFC
jgi:hypothetical protein